MILQSDSATRQLREAGLRLTPQRRAVIEALAGDTTHPLADDVARRVADRIPGVSLSTVYKTLHEFAAIGLVRELDLPGAMRFDADVSDHLHLLCDDCGTVVDIPSSAALESALRDTTRGLSVSSVDITLKGSCTACSVRSAAPVGTACP